MSRPVIVGETLCAEGEFSVVQAPDGRCAALWKAHGRLFDDLAALLAAEVLNQHEQTLLRHRVGAKP